MIPNRLSAKFFLKPSVSIRAEDLIPVFHDWIGRKAVDETLIDVADYSHVHQGPALMLVALEADYVLDESTGKSGIRYIRKRAVPASLESALALVVAQAAYAGHLINVASSSSFFDTSRIEIEILDKLVFPDGNVSNNALESAIRVVANEAFAGSDFDIQREAQDSRRPLKIVLKSSASLSLGEIAQRLKQSFLLQSTHEEVVVG